MVPSPLAGEHLMCPRFDLWCQSVPWLVGEDCP